MYGRNLIEIFEIIREIGLCSSEREFDIILDSKKSRYISNHRRLDGYGRVSPAVVSRLRYGLDSVARIVPPGVAEDVRVVIRRLDEHSKIYAILAR